MYLNINGVPSWDIPLRDNICNVDVIARYTRAVRVDGEVAVCEDGGVLSAVDAEGTPIARAIVTQDAEIAHAALDLADPKELALVLGGRQAHSHDGVAAGLDVAPGIKDTALHVEVRAVNEITHGDEDS